MQAIAHRQSRGTFRRPLRPIVPAVVAVCLVMLAACGGSDDPLATPDASATPTSTASSAEPVSPELEAFVETLMGPGSSVDDLPAIMTEALSRAVENPLSSEQMDTAYECWSNPTCTIDGGGDKSLAIVDGFGGNTWRQVSRMEIILQALTYPEIGKIEYYDSQFDLSKMQANVRTAVAGGADVITSYNDFGASMLPVFQAAQRQGAVVTTYSSPPAGATPEQVTTVIAADNCAFGQNLVKATSELLNGKGNVAILNGVAGNPQGKEWNGCAEDELAESAPDIEITYTGDTGWTPDGTYQAASAMISSGKEIDVVWHDYADPLVSLIQAYDQAGKPAPALISAGTNNALACQWKDAQGTAKEFDLFSATSFTFAGRASLTAAMDKLAGGSPPAEVKAVLPLHPSDDGLCLADAAPDYPGPNGIPDELISRMLSN